MEISAVAGIVAAIFTYPIVALINGWLNRRKVHAESGEIFTAASSKMVDSLIKSINRLEEDLNTTREELEQVRQENVKLGKQVVLLTKELEIRNRVIFGIPTIDDPNNEGDE